MKRCWCKIVSCLCSSGISEGFPHEKGGRIGGIDDTFYYPCYDARASNAAKYSNSPNSLNPPYHRDDGDRSAAPDARKYNSRIYTAAAAIYSYFYYKEDDDDDDDDVNNHDDYDDDGDNDNSSK